MHSSRQDRTSKYRPPRPSLARFSVARIPVGLAAATAVVLALAPAATASPAVEVASAFEENDHFNLHSSITYKYSSRSSTIKREFVGFPGTAADAPVPIVRDLLFSGSQHELVPKLELGVFHNSWLSASLPVVLHSSNSLSFDQRDTPCVFPGGGTPTCINAQNSSTIQDGLLPETGFDAHDPTGPGFTNPNDATIFRGTNRRGTTQLRLGLGVAPMNQEHDESKPTWKIGGEVRLPLGKTKKFNRFDPDQSNGVADGVTHVRLWTSMAKDLGWAEPHFEIWWQAPLTVKKSAPLAPLDQGFGVTSESPQQQAGTTFGVEATVWENPEEELRVGVDLSTTLTSYFEGRGYSDMWEVFAYAGSATQTGAPLVLDEEPTISGVQAKSHPGVSNIENFMMLDTHLRVTADAGERVRFSAGVGLQYEQSHLVSFANAGTDLQTCQGSVVANCERENNDVVTPGTAEVNPLHVPTIDLAGHRYRVSDGQNILFTMNARFLF
ncbi:MAG: hypothetical protein GY811_03665 [Myxococcales bacterium]|nr:hypothetical protein [Myxococcales bacterium]